MNVQSSPRPRPGKWLIATAITLLAAGAILWLATGREGFTRWPSAKLAASDRPPTQEDTELLSSLGFMPEQKDAPPQLGNKFAFGLLPGGFDAKHLPSVLLCVCVSSALLGAVVLHSIYTQNAQGGTR